MSPVRPPTGLRATPLGLGRVGPGRLLAGGLLGLATAIAAAAPSTLPAPTPANPADNCTAIVAQIDAKLRAGGLVNYTLVTAALDAPDTGRVIGSCGNGRRKILYSSVGPQAPGAAAVVTSSVPGVGTARPGRIDTTLPGAPPPTPESILTECRDGWTGPDCRQRLPAPPRP